MYTATGFEHRLLNFPTRVLSVFLETLSLEGREAKWSNVVCCVMSQAKDGKYTVKFKRTSEHLYSLALDSKDTSLVGKALWGCQHSLKDVLTFGSIADEYTPQSGCVMPIAAGHHEEGKKEGQNVAQESIKPSSSVLVEVPQPMSGVYVAHWCNLPRVTPRDGWLG